METLTLSKYFEIIPSETKDYVNLLFRYLCDDLVIEFDTFEIDKFHDALYFKSLVAYSSLNEKNRNTMYSLGFDDYSHKIRYKTLEDSKKKELFGIYYNYLTPLDDEDLYSILSPEDIINNIKAKIPRFDECNTNHLIKKSKDSFFKGLEKKSKEFKKNHLNKFKTSFNKDLPFNIVKYFEAVGKVYNYLCDNKNLIKVVSTSQDDLINISLFIGYFIFEKNSNEEMYEDQKILNNYFNQYNVSLDKIIEILGLDFESKELEKHDPTIALYLHFKKILNRYDKVTLPAIMIDVLNNKIVSSFAVEQLLDKFNLSCDINRLAQYVKEVRDDDSDVKADDLTNSLLPDTYECVLFLAKMYNYLLEQYNKDKIDKNVVDSKDDLIDLCIIFAAFKYNDILADYLKSINLDLETIINTLGVSVDFKYDKYTDKDIVKFNRYLTGGLNYNKSKSIVTVSSIISNIYKRDINDSDILDRLNKIVNKNDELDKKNNGVEKLVTKYINEKENERLVKLEESLLKGINKDVYHLLKDITSYYDTFNQFKVDINEDMKISLSIIFGVSMYNSSLRDFLEDKGLSRSDIIKKIHDGEFRPINQDLNIDILNDKFKQYIFDRDTKDITIYSILENAFKLNTNFEFDKLLYSFNLTKDDFTNIKDKVASYEEETIKRKHKEKVTMLFVKCGSIRGIIDDAIRLYKYIKSCVESSDLYSDMIKTDDDIEELSLLIALLKNDKDTYIPYFYHNGLTLEEILKATGFTQEELDRLDSLPLDEDIILQYEKYIQDSYMDSNTLVHRMFDDRINGSKIIERITEKAGYSYDGLKEETLTQKFRDLTPEQGIILLSKLVAPVLSGKSIVDLATFGDDLNKHSSLINDQLHQLVVSNSVEHSAEDINELCNGVVITNTPKRSIIDIIKKKQPTISEKLEDKANIISDLRDRLDDNTAVLNEELKGYEFIKNYIEVLLIKYNEYLKILEDYRDCIEAKAATLDESKPEDFNELLNYSSLKKIVDNKINTFKTSITLMKQELIKVHNAIVTHFIAINSLSTSKDAILPLIASELALSIGTRSEAKALGISKDLFNLLQSVVNQNVIETQDNLNKLLSVSELDTTALNYMNQSITSYINMINTSYELPEKEDVKKKELKNEL